MEVLPKGANELSPLDGGSAGGSKFGSRLPYRFSKLTFYDLSPSLEISLEEFEHFAIDRLRVLKGLEEAMSRGKKPEELGDLVGKLWEEYMRTPNASEALNKDLISHFVLRLVYCRTDELRRWFLQMETALFRYRFRLESRDAQKMFMEDCNLPYKAITREEVEVVKDYLDQVARSLNQSTRNSIYFKVPFEEVPELVAGRKVFLQKGNAFVPLNQITSLVVIHFRSRLSKALVLTNRKWTTTLAEKEKHRLGPILESLGSCYLGPDYSKPSDSLDISLKDIDKLANTSFPLCMRSLFYKLKEDHHLKHGGRMQLGLFLKGVGLKLEDALAFWRSEFSQKIGVERFDKEYAYSIRHNYGKEGKRMDYSPYSCQKIIMSTPGVGDHHGCPYRHFSDDNLRAALGRMGINGRSVDEIMDKVHERHYQIACTLTFEALHGCSCDTGINHPNQYFIESQKVLQAKNVGPDVAGTPATPVKSESH